MGLFDGTESLPSGIVEGLTGRPVRDVLSQVSAEDEATEIFVLDSTTDLLVVRQ